MTIKIFVGEVPKPLFSISEMKIAAQTVIWWFRAITIRRCQA